MFQLLIKICVLFLISLFISCGFVDIRPIEYSTNPSSQNTVLPSHDTPVSASFKTEMEREKTEKIFSVTANNARIEGDIVWTSNTINFHPVGGWSPGVRYTLKLDGDIYAKDGRVDTAYAVINFYSVSDAPMPYLANYFPANGESVGVTPESGGKLQLIFSGDMDRRSVEDALVIDGVNNKLFFWKGDSELEVTSDKQLEAWRTYKWTLRESAKSKNGIPLNKIYSAVWTTDFDKILPQVKNIYPMMKSDSGNGYNWSTTGAPIETGLGHEQAIGIEFTKEMDEKSVIASVHIEPALAGRTEVLTPRLIIFIPNKDPEPEIIYILTILSDTKDSYGLKINSEKSINFTADIPYLNIASIELNSPADNLKNDEIKNNAVISTKVTPASQDLFAEIVFSLPLTNQSRADIPSKIILDPFFPNTLGPVSLVEVDWSSASILTCIWIGVIPGTKSNPHYYKLTVPGGQTGITNGNGSYLKESISIFIEAVKE
jgi:hypothetical protein